MKLQLTQKEKEIWVTTDYNIGRIFSMINVELHPQYKKDTKLQILFNGLYNYDKFGSGDEYENACWHDILDYLELNETYEKLWENL